MELATVAVPGWVDPRLLWERLNRLAQLIGAAGTGSDRDPWRIPPVWNAILGTSGAVAMGLAYSRDGFGALTTHVVLWDAALDESEASRPRGA
ncbi:MAG: hypothetical protein K6U14_00565 [Firmicutes bacterium]|nr:hypothetical protein [Alicyclobacillaceae bacterium]MCL6496111.1 hypothetical protein [Bacillota bacterium]